MSDCGLSEDLSRAAGARQLIIKQSLQEIGDRLTGQLVAVESTISSDLPVLLGGLEGASDLRELGSLLEELRHAPDQTAELSTCTSLCFAADLSWRVERTWMALQHTALQKATTSLLEAIRLLTFASRQRALTENLRTLATTWQMGGGGE